MRIVMLEKWEGPCWDDCLANATAGLRCEPACNVEADSLATLRRVRAINPAVSNVLYLNTLLMFPFYSLAQKYIDAGALLTVDTLGRPPFAPPPPPPRALTTASCRSPPRSRSPTARENRRH